MKITIEREIDSCFTCPFKTYKYVKETLECKFAWVNTSWTEIPKECPLLYDKVLTKKYNVKK